MAPVVLIFGAYIQKHNILRLQSMQQFIHAHGLEHISFFTEVSYQFFHFCHSHHPQFTHGVP